MNRSDIYDCLCWYDKRRPLRDLEAEDFCRPTPGKGCCCDSCFHGKHQLANALLDAMDRIEELEHFLKKEL